MSDIRWTTEKRRLGDLIKWEQNPRQLTTDQAVRLRRSIDEFGYSQLYEIEPDNTIVDGHQRDEVMLRMEQFGPGAEIEVRVASRKLTLEERKAYIALKHRGAMGEWNWDEMHNLYEFEELEGSGFDAKEIFKHGFEKEEPPEDPGPQVDRAEELREKWGVELGQLWQLGEHRLICGDCTDYGVMGTLFMHEEDGLASFCFTDPPYGVKYTGGTKEWTMLENDDEVNMYAASLPIIYEFTKAKAPLYIAFADANAMSVYNSIYGAGYIQRALIIWNKNHAQFGAMGSQYKQKHEPIAYCYKKGEAPYWYGPNNEVTVWDIDRASKNEYHPTEKPIPLVERAMRNSAPENSLVLDPFLGSGTTLIACERLGRKCRAAEISPAYCAVAIERWVEMTGQEPVILQD